MKKNHWLARALGLLALSLVLNGTISAAAEAGSSGDPLVSLSYLNETYLQTILSKVDSRIAERNTALIAQLGGSGSGGGTAASFTVVTLSSGQVLKGEIGCEVMLRVGTASCVAPSAPGLIDETGGSTLNNGAGLVKNHLYMMTIEDRGVKATAGTVKLLVRGGYQIG